MIGELLPRRDDPHYHDAVRAIVNGLLLAGVAVADANLGAGEGLRVAQRIATMLANRDAPN